MSKTEKTKNPDEEEILSTKVTEEDLVERIEYCKLSKPRGINESCCEYDAPKQLTEEEFNTLEWVDADSVLDEIDKIIEKGRKDRDDI